MGGHFGQNGQKLYENCKIIISRAKQRVTWGEQGNFLGSSGDSTPIPPLGKTHYGVPKPTSRYKLVIIMLISMFDMQY